MKIIDIINRSDCFSNTRWFYYYDIRWTDNGRTSKIVLRHDSGDIITFVYRSTHNTQINVYLVYETEGGKQMAEHFQKKLYEEGLGMNYILKKRKGVRKK
jgi:hypothetical protein